MARSLHVYPKATLVDSTWLVKLSVAEFDDADGSILNHMKFKPDIPAGVTAEIPLPLLKMAFDLITDHTGTDDFDTVVAQDVYDAIFVDDIQPGGGYETVWSNWQEQAEATIEAMSSPHTRQDFWSRWTKQAIQSVRDDARRALITQRGWTVPVGEFYQRLGDGSKEVT